MMPFFSSTKSLSNHLRLFFAVFSLVIGALSVSMIAFALHWAEDNANEKRITLDKQEAVKHYLSGKRGEIKIDHLTTAFDKVADVPALYRQYLEGKEYFLQEVEEGERSRTLYLSHYIDHGIKKPVVLLSYAETVEMSNTEFTYIITLVLGVIALLTFSFSTLLYRISTHLIEPINHLNTQLEQHKGSLEQPFIVPPKATVEFKLLAEQLNQYRQEVNNLVKREQAFARYTSHEVRTPLTIIKGANSLLALQEQDEKKQKQIQRISRATTQISTIVDALLSLVYQERHAKKPPLRQITKAELEEVISANQPQQAAKAIQFKTKVTGEPVTHASEAVIFIVFGNIIRNAIAATEQGVVEITLTDQKLTVRDNGSFIADEPHVQGHGLGLLIVDEFCTRYQWQFSLQNHPKGGVQACIRF